MRGVKGSRQGKGTQGPVTGKEKFQAELYIKHHTSVQVKSDNLETKNLLPIPDGTEKIPCYTKNTYFFKTITWLLKQEKQPLCRKYPELLTSYPKSLY